MSEKSLKKFDQKKKNFKLYKRIYNEKYVPLLPHSISLFFPEVNTDTGFLIILTELFLADKQKCI